MSNTVRDSSRVFIGGVAVTALTWAYLHGHIFAPVADTVAYSLAPASDDNLRGVGDLLANVLTGALYIAGEIAVIAFTIAWNLTRSVIGGLLSFLLSWSDSGRDVLGWWNDRSTDALVGSGVGNVPGRSATIATGTSTVEERLAIAEKTIADLIPAIQRNRAARKDHQSRIESIESQQQTFAAELLRVEQEKTPRRTPAVRKKP